MTSVECLLLRDGVLPVVCIRQRLTSPRLNREWCRQPGSYNSTITRYLYFFCRSRSTSTLLLLAAVVCTLVAASPINSNNDSCYMKRRHGVLEYKYAYQVHFIAFDGNSILGNFLTTNHVSSYTAYYQFECSRRFKI